MSDVQLNARISEEANNKLIDALERHNRISKQQLIEDLITLYLGYWEELQKELPLLKQEWVKQQLKQRPQEPVALPEKRQAG